MADTGERFYERLLIARCQAGDGEAFAELVARYQPRLSYFVRKLLGRTQGADDLLQDVWLDVVRSLPKLRDSGAFPAWLYRIARDRAYRAMRRGQFLPKSLAGDDVAAASDDSEFDAQDVALVHVCLDDISLEHREVLVLRFLQDMSYEQIAGVVGCEVGTVRSRLHYAKGALRRVVERKRS
jgi:RNA polymerase sigma-70 factor (ECF subfamily)